MIDAGIEKSAPPRAGDWLVGGGELGELIRAKDWARTPLGRIEDWPQSLRSAVSILLPSKAQIVLFWGSELIAIYNDAYRPVFGAKHPWALGMPARQCWQEVWNVLEPLFTGVLRTGEAFWARDHLFGLERNGYVEETYFDVSYDPVRDESGRVGGVFCIVSETTGRIVGERRLGALRDLGRIGRNAASVSDVLQEAAGVLRAYDKDVPFAEFYRRQSSDHSEHLEATVGFSPEDETLQRVLASNSDALLDDVDIQLLDIPAELRTPSGPWPEKSKQLALLKIATPGKPPYGYMVAGISPRKQFDEDYRDFFRLVAANIASAIAAMQALEDERRRATALAELDRAKTAFFSNVSHEFRTPLTLMLGPLEDLLAQIDNGAQRDLLAIVQRNGQRLLKLVNTLLDFARIEADRTQAAFKSTDLAAFTTDLASNFRAACERAGIELNVECAPLAEAAYVDRSMWEKIVLNLLSNAFKFTFEGSITVRLSAVDANFELHVSDTGVGIPAAELPRIFDRFHRVQSTRSRSYEGSGIGLALVAELVKLHGGSIRVQSTPNVGSEFIVTIPKGATHLPPERVAETYATNQSDPKPRAEAYLAEALSWLPKTTPAVAVSQQRCRILLADDNADLSEYICNLLADRYDVHTVADGQAALEIARAYRPDLVISDVMMPQLDGFGLLRALRDDVELRTTPVILLSARAGEEARLEGLAQGADDYIVKPFSSRELLVRVGALLNAADMHRRAREALLQFETLLHNAPLGVYLIDDRFRIIAANPVAIPMFGDIPGLLGRDFDAVLRTLWPQAEADEIVRLFRHTLTSGEPHVVPEFTRTRADRGVECYEWQINRIPLPNDRHGVVCYFRDISKTVAAREALRDADTRKDEFLATLSHELRNPLAPLRSSLEVLRRNHAANPRTDTALDIMDRQVGYLVRLVDDLLELSRITRGNLELRKEPLRLDVVLRNAVESLQPLIFAGGHRLEILLPSEPIAVVADAVRLAQIFGNLLNNASKYSERGGTIMIKAWREGNEAVVDISDTGDGMDEQQLSRLFQMFARGSGSAKRHQSGLGIGLALVRRLVEMHGGQVNARSAGLGRGSSFTVRLPISIVQPAPNILKTDAKPRGFCNVLVVDDNRDAAESLCMLLQGLGTNVQVAFNGTDAVSTYEAFRPRVVLLDIGMPDMDGYEVARRLSASSIHPRAVLVAVTGWAQEADRRRAREAGFDHHLVKPVAIDALESLFVSIGSKQHIDAACEIHS